MITLDKKTICLNILKAKSLSKPLDQKRITVVYVVQLVEETKPDTLLQQFEQCNLNVLENTIQVIITNPVTRQQSQKVYDVPGAYTAYAETPAALDEYATTYIKPLLTAYQVAA